jgi:hypothetical protein
MCSGCNEEEENGGNGPTDPQDPLTLTYPSDGATFTVGETVTIKWTGNQDELSSIGVEFSTNGGIEYTQLATETLNPSETSFDWVVTSSHVTNQGVLRVVDYTNTDIQSYASNITVTQ